MNIKETAQEVFEGNKEKGFWDQERNVGEMLMLVVTELSEALEAHRKENFSTINGKVIKDKIDLSSFKSLVKDTFEDEIADAVIRLFDISHGLGIDLEWHMRQKMNYNKTRERLHGKKY